MAFRSRAYIVDVAVGEQNDRRQTSSIAQRLDNNVSDSPIAVIIIVPTYVDGVESCPEVRCAKRLALPRLHEQQSLPNT